MLVGALAVTVVGFILLVLALALSSAWLAWACIVVCVIGFGLLIADVLGMRRPAAEAPAAQPEADYPPAPAAEVEEAGAAQPEQSQEAPETSQAVETDTAETDGPEPGEEPAAQSEPGESAQVADEGEDAQTDRAE